MLYKEFHPGTLLSAFVRCFWVLEGEQSQTSVQRVVPDGSPEMVFHYGDPFQKWCDHTKRWEVQNPFLMIGQATQSLLLRPGLRTGVVGVRFHPYGAAPFLNFPLAELTNQIVPTSEVPFPQVPEVAERITLALTIAERIGVIRKFLEERLRSEPDRMLVAVVRFLAEHCEHTTICRLSAQFHTTERSLQRKFHQAIGLSPKQFMKTIRFQRVLKILQNRRDLPLAYVAQEAGYFDQSHFIHEFKEFAALSPSRYLAELHELSDHFNSN
jgi:AraC-like DNA-binding protein